jgi:FkbM family methyltransferase
VLALHEALSQAERRRFATPERCRATPEVVDPEGPTTRWCQLFTGQPIRVAVPETVGNDLYRYGYIEAAVTRVLLEHLGPGMAFFDVGAHYGYHSLVASLLVGSAGTVIAFEPGRVALAHLRASTAGLGNVRVEPVALDAAAGTGTFTDFGAGHSSLNTLLDAARVPAAERPSSPVARYEVPTTTVDHYVQRTQTVPAVVKIDAEGAELAILHGMEAVLTRHAPLVIVETGDYPGADAPPTTASIDLLEHHGYRALEYHGGLRPHDRRRSYGYDNLFFRRSS